MHAYILNKGKYYAHISKKNAISKTTSIQTATKFLSQEEANQILIRATKKLKGFHVVELDNYNPEEREPAAKTKRKSFTANERISVYNKGKGRCAICGRFVPVNEFTVDHIIPLAKGGTNEMSNLQCACKVCNAIKQDILPKDLMDKLSEIVLYQTRKSGNFDLLKRMTYVRRRMRHRNIVRIIDIARKKCAS